MKFLHGLFGLLLYLAILAVGGGVAFLALSGQPVWDTAVDILDVESMWAIGLGAALMLLLILFLLTAIHQREAPQYITYTGSNGKVSVKISAVKDLVERVGKDFAAVLAIDPTIEYRRHGLVVNVNLEVAEDSHIPEVCQALQDKVSDCVQEQLGISDLRAVNVNIVEIVKDRKAVDPSSGSDSLGAAS